MLMSRAARMHSTIWRHIRTKHLYLIAAMLSKISAGAELGLLVSARQAGEMPANGGP
jgi:hypothetical protein